MLIWMVFLFFLCLFDEQIILDEQFTFAFFCAGHFFMFCCLRDKTPTTLAQRKTNGQLSFTLLNQSASYCWIETPTQITRLKCKEHYLLLNLAWASEINLFFSFVFGDTSFLRSTHASSDFLMLKGYFNDSNILNNFRYTRLFWSYILKELNLTFNKSFVYYVKVYLKVLLLLIFYHLLVCPWQVSWWLLYYHNSSTLHSFYAVFFFLGGGLSIWFCSFLRLRSFWAYQHDEDNFQFHVLQFVFCSLAKSNHLSTFTFIFTFSFTLWFSETALASGTFSSCAS